MGGNGEALRHRGLKSFSCGERGQQPAKAMTRDLRADDEGPVPGSGAEEDGD
jgi:hypothetical protein